MSLDTITARPANLPPLATPEVSSAQAFRQSGRGAPRSGSPKGVSAKHVPDPIDLYVGGQIRRLRRTLGLSQDALGGKIGLTFQQVQKYERGLNRVSASKLFAICGVLKIDPGALFPPRVERVGDPAPEGRDVLTELSFTPGGLGLAQVFGDLAPLHRRAVLQLANTLAKAEAADLDP